MNLLPRPKNILCALYIRPAIQSILTSLAAIILLGFFLTRQSEPLSLPIQLIAGLLPIHVFGLLAFLHALFPAMLRLGIRQTLQWTPSATPEACSLWLLAKQLGMALAGVFAINIAFMPVFKALGIETQDQTIVLMAKQAGGSLTFMLLAFFAVSICAPIAEEIIFRLGCHNAVNAYFSTQTSTILTSLCFAVMHGQLQTLPPLFFIGYLLQNVKQQHGLRQSILLHAAYNTTEMLMLWLIITVTMPD